MKRTIGILLAVLMLASVCGAAFADNAPAASKKETEQKILSLQKEYPDSVFYDNEGMFLPIPKAYSALVTVETPEKNEYGELFSVSETASIKAAEATGQYTAGAGWLFSISRVTEEQLHQMLCYLMFGSEVFGRDEDGMYYLFEHPTDVRIVRESYDNMDADMAIWSELNQWAWQEKENFMTVNPGVHAEARGNSEPEIQLARAAWMEGQVCTLSTEKGGTRESASADAVPYVERLTTKVFIDSADGIEVPKGETLSLNMPSDGLRLDFFPEKGSENLIRIVHDDGRESLWQAEYEDGKTKAAEIMREWYEALKS